MESMIRIFLVQLRQLLGIPGPKTEHRLCRVLNVDPKKAVSMREIDNLMRYHLFYNIDTSISTLISLSNLIQRLTNMVVEDNIGELSKTATSKLFEVI